MPPISSENVRWRLKQVHGGNIFDINTTDSYMVGRSQNAHISLNSNKTSRTHSSFVVNVEGHLLLQDLKSVNGTFVNGTQIAVYASHRVFPGDIIGFGMPDIELSESDKDKLTFFIVLFEEPAAEVTLPVEASLADSTTDREHLGINSIDQDVQSACRNSTAEIKINSFVELPSSSTTKQELLDIIEISSSTSDEEKPDLDDCFEEGDNCFEDVAISINVNVNEKVGISAQSNLNKDKTNDLREKKKNESDRLTKNLDSQPAQKGLDNKSVCSKDLLNSYLESYLVVNKEDSAKPANIIKRRKSLAASIPEDNVKDSRNIKGMRRKSIAEEPSHSRPPEEDFVKKNVEVLKTCKSKEVSKYPTTVTSRRISDKISETVEPGKIQKKRSSKCFSKINSLAANSPNRFEDSHTRNSKRVEVNSAIKEPNRKKSAENKDKNKDAGTKRLEEGSMALKGIDDDMKKNKNEKKSDESLLKSTSNSKIDETHDDLLFQLEQAISGKDDLSLRRTETNTIKRTEPKTETFKKGDKKKLASEEKTPPLNKHKKVKIDDCGEFIFSRPRHEEIRENPLAADLGNSINCQKSTTSSKSPELDNQKKELTKNSKDAHNNSSSSIHTIRETPKDESDAISKDRSSKNTKILEKSFTTDKDNSVIIDITEDDDDMDFSCSQIFHMSQLVKLETQDDTYQKIKDELAEMEFCEEETIINSVPINLEDDMSGFENTQDICACLEEDFEGNKDNDNIISNEENQELLAALGDFNEDPANKDNNLDEDMEVSLDESSVVPKNDQNLAALREDSGKIDCEKFFGKSKYVKPPLIEPHKITKPRKSPIKQDSKVIKEENKRTKRKNSLETPVSKKKLKGSPKSCAEPPRCDTKSIQMEFKKRTSGSKVEQENNKILKIREERRKKLKEITEQSFSPKKTETKSAKGKTVKVLPDSKTRRGSFLCEEPKKNSGETRRCSTDRNSSGPINQKKNVKKDSNDEWKCNKLGTLGYQMEYNVHKVNSSEKLHDSSSSINDNHPQFKKPPRRCNIPNADIKDYKIKPLNLPDPNTSLRRTKSSGDIKADLIKPDDQSRPTHLRYNGRHSAFDASRNNAVQDPLKNYMGDVSRRGNDLTIAKEALPQYSGGVMLRPEQNPRFVMPHQMNQINRTQARSYSTVSRTDHDLSRRLMWTNGGPSRRAPVRRLLCVDDVVQKMINWLPNWLTEQVDIDDSAPVNNPPAEKIPLNFTNFDHYRDTFTKLVLLENWQYSFKGFREGSEKSSKAKIEHVRVAHDLQTLDCISYISEKDLKAGNFYKPEDFVLVESIVNDENNSYISVSFGVVQNCKKTTISNNDVISIRLGNCCRGIPHTKLEFSILTRHQPGKEVNTKKFPIIRILVNIRAHMMMIRAIKGLIYSPLRSKILFPRINEYRFAVTHNDIIQPHPLNTQQRSIVLEAASLCTGQNNGIYCIKGPPGTGKSTVIVHLLFQILFSYYVTKKTKELPMILLAAPSNAAVDNLVLKLADFKRSLGSEWDKYKPNIKSVRIGPEASVATDVAGYTLPKLAEKHLPVKHMDVPEFRAARERNENMLEFSKKFFGDRFGSEIKACEDLIIQKSNVICTTLNSCINGKLIDAVNRGMIKFTCCIIDEATQCHEVEALLPTILGIDKFVLVGDPKQLNATILNRDALKLGFGESLFSRISNNFVNDPRSPIRMLTDQYRMHQEICAFPNRHFYDGKLRSLPKPFNKLPDKIRPYLVFNCEKINESSDYTNIDEVNLIKKMLSTIFGMIDRNHKYTVGIITPYNAQKNLINRNIDDLVLRNSNCKLTVNTVDSFQGSENDIVIISCVRDSTNSFLQNENRLNVALTRAKQALYIIGNYTLFKECRTLYDLREDAKNRKLLLDIRQDPMTIDNFRKYLIKKNSVE